MAQSTLSTNEVIFVEKPLVSSQFSWNKTYGYLACEHCMYPLESAEDNFRRLASDASMILPYPEADPTRDHQEVFSCSDCPAKFCSEECLAEAEKKYHKVMCKSSLTGQPFDEINEIWKLVHLLEVS